MSRKKNNKKSTFAPDDETINSRIQTWENLFKKYENCCDCEDDGMEMDTLIAIALVEDEYSEKFKNENDDDPENIDPNEEAIEEIVNDQDIKKNSSDNLTLFFSPDFIQKVTEEYRQRSAELAKRNLPYWKIEKDEKYQETINKLHNGFSASRNYESNTTASTNNFKPDTTIVDPRQNSNFFSSIPVPFNPEVFRLSPEIQQYIQNNSVVNVRIREYDLTVCKDLQNSSISISIPKIDGIQAFPARLNDIQKSKTLPTLNDEPSEPKKSRQIKETDFDDIKMNDISTAGSSLSTEDDDLYFIGGEARCKMRRLNHRLKKLEERREERRNKLKLAKKEIEATKNQENKIVVIVDSDGSTPDDDEFF